MVPITLVVAAIAAVVAAGVALYKNWDTVKEYAAKFGEFLSGIWEGIKNAVSGLVNGIKDAFTNAFSCLVGIVKAPINAVISIINGAIGAINSIGFDIPDWVPFIGGKKFALNIPKIPMLATGGFTNGPSIAGEAGTEAVISFDPAYRAANISYWEQAGRMLGLNVPLSGGGSSISLGGVTFSPQITVTGNADKRDIIEAIEDAYPEFLDMLEEFLMDRRATVYG